jgi:hypothetical protein
MFQQLLSSQALCSFLAPLALKWLHPDALLLPKRLQGSLNQTILALEDLEGFFVMSWVSFTLAAAVGHQLAACWL